MINDDTSGLFGTDPNSPTPASLRQGVVQAWNASTGENEVLVGGTDLVNIPVLTSESASLKVGDVVSLVTDGAKWLLLGKVTTPGDPGTVPTWVGDLTALTPLVPLAGVTDGLVMTGATNSTADSGAGARIVINDPAWPNRIALFTDNPAEIEPSLIWPIGAGGTRLRFRGPKVALGAPATFDLESNEATGESTFALDADLIRVRGVDTEIDGFSSLRLGDGSDYITLAGHTIDAETGPLALVGTGATTSNGVPIVTTTDTQTLTNKDLSSGTNTLPTSVVTLTGSQTLTNKNLTGAGNTFPTSLVTLTGTQTLTNKNLSDPSNIVPAYVATLTGSQTLANKDLTASTNTFPGQMLTQILSAAMTGAAVNSTTTEADITGASVTFSTAKANARYAVTASFYYGASTGGTGVATGKLNIDGSNQAAQANFTGATTLDRANVAQSWTGTLAASGSHTFKLRHVMTGTGTFAVNPTHTALTIQIFE